MQQQAFRFKQLIYQRKKKTKTNCTQLFYACILQSVSVL